MTPDSIAVVIPAFNAERHLAECVRSIVCQSEVSEIIIVDDGSNDGTNELAQSLALGESRIRVCRKENGGVASARNAGLASVTAPFVAFVDADDVIPGEGFAKLLRASDLDQADMTYGDFGVLSGGHIDLWPDEFASFAPGKLTVRECIASLASANPMSISGSCCRILFRTSFLKKSAIVFPEGIAMSEDFCFILDCLTANPSVAYVNDCVYLVRREGGSATQRFMPDLERSMDFVNTRLRVICQSEKRLMSKYWECVSNTAWHACRTIYKDGSPFDRAGRRAQLARILSKYREAIGETRLSGDLPAVKAMLLKLGASHPSVFWMVMEINHKGGK